MGWDRDGKGAFEMAGLGFGWLDLGWLGGARGFHARLFWHVRIWFSRAFSRFWDDVHLRGY